MEWVTDRGIDGGMSCRAGDCHPRFVRDADQCCALRLGPASVVPELFRVVGQYAGQILRGTRPGDLPLQRPSRFEPVINLRTASALGLTIPSILTSRADAVIEWGLGKFRAIVPEASPRDVATER
jgi:ABC transporter substrate binding protein